MTQHGGGAPRNKIFPVGKPCDYCNSAAALIFCLSDSAFVCMSCDTKLHNGNHKHKRVWMCDVCEQAPAAFNCKADSATLCVTCDRDIHSANPLARRHDRTPVVPFYDTAESMVTNHDHLLLDHDAFSVPTNESSDHMIPGLSLSVSSNTNMVNNTSKLTEDFMFSDSDHFLDQISSHPYSDSIVPEQTTFKLLPIQTHFITPDHQSEMNRFEMDFTKSNMNSYNNYTTLSLSHNHSISSSSMDVGIVPDGSVHAMSDISFSFSRNMNSSIDNIPVVGMDREARVLRYKEKRKNRKFEKTIRYASRKAYAETRPRIKGRFAKRIDSEADMDQIFGSGSANFMADSRFGIVPSF